MDKKYKPLYLGSAYYPEDWDVSEMPKDIAKMKEMGMNVARMAEFAWAKMEPEEGKFDFKWLHDAVDMLAANGIKSILGTPSATPPRWLSVMYPDVFYIESDGNPRSHGGRRDCCSNNPHYRYYSARIAEEMAKEFGNDENVIGWQIDNEIYSWTGCFCPECLRKFQLRLKEKYKTIENLNKEWELNCWSQKYDSFNDIPSPRGTWHNPNLCFEWYCFHNESHIDFLKMQADILRKYTKAPIGTDCMPLNGLDYEKVAAFSDVIQFNHYNTRDNLWVTNFWFDFLRTLKDKPFWNTETATCWNGSTDIGQSIKPEGFCRVNSFMPVALGGEANLYWLWRTHRAGHELVHGGVLYPNGRPYHIANEVKDTAEILKKATEFIRETKVDTKVALHFTSKNWNMLYSQALVAGFKYIERLQSDMYKPLIKAGVRPDVIGAKADLSKYEVIFSPFMMTLEDGNLPENIKSFVENGGTWVAGPMTDIRNWCGANYNPTAYGMLEDITDAYRLYQIPDTEGIIKAKWADGEEFTGNRIYDVYEESDGALASITAGHSALINKPILVKKSYGKGTVYLLGTIPGEKDMIKLIKMVLKEKNIEPMEFEGGVTAVKRTGENKNGIILIENAAESASFTPEKKMKDILSGEIYEGKISLTPYQILILEEI